MKSSVFRAESRLRAPRKNPTRDAGHFVDAHNPDRPRGSIRAARTLHGPDYFEVQRTRRSGMSFCDRCGCLYKVEEASGAAAAMAVDGLVARCTGCNRCENVKTAFDNGVTENSSTSDMFLFKYGIEPMNPDGSKFGAVKDVTRERAVVDEKCPKCAHKGLNFYTMQLRSVDEGQTVFYECPKCGHTFSQNN